MGSKQEVKDLASFLIKARKLYGDKYDYSKVVYVKVSHKVIIRCVEHDHEFEKTINAHISGGQGCPICARESVAAHHRKPLSFFIERATKQHNGKYDYSLVEENAKANDKVSIICPVHGVFKQNLHSHSTGSQCKKCTAEANGLRCRSTLERFLEKAYAVHGDRYDYSEVEYKSSHCYIDVICREHGKFTQRADHHLKTQGCPKCVSITKGDLYRFTSEEFIAKAKCVHGDKYDYSQTEYFNSQTRVDIVCKEHGVFTQVPNVHLYAGGCPKCSTQRLGYRSNLTGYFYILKVTEDIYKFGITNNFDKRLKGINIKSIYESEPLYVFRSEDGYVVRKLESEIIASSISRGVLKKDEMLSGFTETFYKDDLPKVLEIVYKYFEPT